MSADHNLTSDERQPQANGSVGDPLQMGVQILWLALSKLQCFSGAGTCKSSCPGQRQGALSSTIIK